MVHPDTTHLPYVAVAPVKRETIATSLSIAGQFIPYQNVDLHAKVAGYIRTINVDIGDRVHKGQVLAVLEIPELVAEVMRRRRPYTTRKRKSSARTATYPGLKQIASPCTRMPNG